MTDIIIVGAGPAGLSAAVYARRAGMSTTLYEGEMYGGQIVNTPEIENYPAIAKISGFDFANDLYNQAIKQIPDSKLHLLQAKLIPVKQ